MEGEDEVHRDDLQWMPAKMFPHRKQKHRSLDVIQCQNQSRCQRYFFQASPILLLAELQFAIVQLQSDILHECKYILV